MKKIFSILGFFFVITYLKAQEPLKTRVDYSTDDLIIRGSIKNTEENESLNCKVELFSENTVKDSILLESGNTFEFKLKQNSTYAIRISKKDYVTRVIYVDGTLPSGIIRNRAFTFRFSTKLTKVALLEKFNKSENSIPKIVVYYDSKLNIFYYYKDRPLTANKDYPHPYRRFDFKL